jgi:hypothetical protein
MLRWIILALILGAAVWIMDLLIKYVRKREKKQ